MNAVGVILGGGEGSRLQPLTRDRAKPAVPLAGKYRLVDVPISNCINSDIKKIFLLTQFNSVSLHQHTQSSYQFDSFNDNYVRIMAAQQTPGADSWYTGTADAVRKTLNYYVEEQPDYVVILSGDQLYRMDFKKVIQEHIDRKADVTITTKPVPRTEAFDLGIMQVDKKHQIVNFKEKPGDTPALTELKAPGFDDERYLASMGIYIFNTKVLKELLDNDFQDFGKNIIPKAIEEYDVFSHIFDDYWKDIGTIGSFWECNLALTDIKPEFTFYDATAPIYTRSRFLPPSKINGCDLKRTLLTEGSILSGESITRSVVGVRQTVGEGTTIEHSVLLGADFYDAQVPPVSNTPNLGIGRDCVIRNAIIDKNVRIGNKVTIVPEGKKDGEVTDMYTVRDGVIVVPKNAIIPDGTIL